MYVCMYICIFLFKGDLFRLLCSSSPLWAGVHSGIHLRGQNLVRVVAVSGAPHRQPQSLQWLV